MPSRDEHGKTVSRVKKYMKCLSGSSLGPVSLVMLAGHGGLIRLRGSLCELVGAAVGLLWLGIHRPPCTLNCECGQDPSSL